MTDCEHLPGESHVEPDSPLTFTAGNKVKLSAAKMVDGPAVLFNCASNYLLLIIKRTNDETCDIIYIINIHINFKDVL